MNIEQMVISIIILIVGARLLGEIFRRIKQPTLGGQLLAGIILGPTIFGIVLPTQDLELISTITIFFVMLFIGLEMDLRGIKKVGKSAFIISVISLVIPFVIGYQISIFFEQNFIQSLFIGLLLSVTSVPVTALILRELDILKNKIGTTVMSVAIIDDILSLIILAVILQLYTSDGEFLNFVDLSVSVIQISLYLIGIVILALIVYKFNNWFPFIFKNFSFKTKAKEITFVIFIIIAISLSIIADLSGLHFIIGTFFAGLIFSGKILGKKESDKSYKIMSKISFGFFAPLFFAIVGIKFIGQSLETSLYFLILLIILGISGKTFGGYIGAKICKFPKKQSITIATLLNGRGTVGLTITAMAYSMGILDTTLFSICVTICFVTTVITPIITKPLLGKTIEME